MTRFDWQGVFSFVYFYREESQMAGPKGQGVSLPLIIKGAVVCTFMRYSQHERRVFRHNKACPQAHRLQVKTQCKECGSPLEPKHIPDVDGILGVSAPADSDEGKAQREVASAVPQEAREVLAARAAKSMERAQEAVEEVPTKMVCTACDKDYSAQFKSFCVECDTFVDISQVAYEREGKPDYLLTSKDREQLDHLRLPRGLHLMGLLPAGFNFQEWETGETFSLVPKDNDPRAHEFRGALHHLKSGALVYYCSADEKDGLTLKNEWVAVMRTAMGGRSLLLTQLRAKEDITHREHNLGPFTEGVHAFIGVLLSSRVDPDLLKVFSRQSKARAHLIRLLDGSATMMPRAEPIEEGGEIGHFIDQLTQPNS